MSLASVHFGIDGPRGGPQAYAEIVDGESAPGRVPLSRWVSVGCFQAAPDLDLAAVTTVTTTTSATTTTTDPNATTVTLTTTTTETTTTGTTTTVTTTITTTSTTTIWVNCSALNATSEPNPACFNATVRNGTRRPTREERLAAAMAAAAAMLRAATTTTTTTTPPAAMDPAECSQVCESLQYPIAAVRGMECFCVHSRTGLSAADAARCDFQCPVQYFNATTKFCGGADDHFSLYQEYDFMHSGAQGCLDPWRRVWYQSVAIARFREDHNGNPIPDGYDWYLHATSVDKGDPLFPYNHPLSEMVIGLHYDLDSSRVLGLVLPHWAGKVPTEKWEPSVLAVYMNSLRPDNVTFDISTTLVDMTDPEIAALPEWLAVAPGLDFVMSSQATAFDSTNNVYFLTVPDVPIEGYINFDRNRPIYNYTRFGVRILGINLNEGVSRRILFNRALSYRVGLLEVNSAFHDLFALVLDGDTDQWTYVTLGWSNRSADGGPDVGFNWTFSSIPEAAVEPSSTAEYSNKTCQVGSGAIDHWSHTSLFPTKKSSYAAQPFQVMDLRNAPGPGPAAKTNLADLIPAGAQAAYLMNLHPIVPWLPFPKAVDARFDMDGVKVYVKWPAHTYAGIRPVDFDGDSVPDYIDFSPRQLGPSSCLEMFSFMTAIYMGADTLCEWAVAVEPHSLITITMPTADTLLLGDELVIKNGTVFTYLNYTGQISLFSIDQVILEKPLPLYDPVIQLRWKASSNPFAPVNEATLTDDPDVIGEASLCQRGELNSVLSYYHGGMPKWFWTLDSVACTTITGVDFEPNSFLVQEVKKRLAEGSAGDAYYPEGHHIVKLPRDEIEPGCVYTMKLRLYSRWDRESTHTFRVTKTAPLGAINWMPPCPYMCNPATCEPPSACNAQGVCVCAPGTYGTFCSGICPTCSRRGSLGCDDGRFGSGTCICRLGYDGDLCRQRLEWRDHEFGPCEGACNSPRGVRTRIMKCTNVETEEVLNASRCPPAPPPDTENCVPPLCDCGLPPTVPGVDSAALELLCPETLSGGICLIHCGANGTQSTEYITIGVYRCYAGSFVEVPQCSPTGGQLQGLPAIVMVLSLTVDVPAGVDLQAYVEATMGPELRSTVAEYLTGRGVGVASQAVTLTVKPAIPGRRRLSEASSPPPSSPSPLALPAPAQGRRLEAIAISITIMVGFASVADKRAAEGYLTVASTNPDLITTTFLEKLRTAAQPLPTVSRLDPPVSSQVYVANVTEFLGPVPLVPTRTTASPQQQQQLQQQLQQQQGDQVVVAAPAPEDTTTRWLTGLGLGFGAGAVGMTSCCAVGFLLCWQQRRRRKAGRIEPLRPESPRTKHQTFKVSPPPVPEPQPALALPAAALLAHAGSSTSPAPSPGASPRSVQNEARIHLALDHPNIAQLRQVYDECDAMHIVMECLEGGELFSRLVARKRFSEAEAAEAARQVLYAVSYLHSHDVVHCDIKLENLLYERKDSQHLKLVDFGFAQRCKGRDRLSRRCGTSCYMAPEVFGGSYGAEADIWSVGVVVYMLLVGKPPYAGRDQAVRAKAAKGKLDFAPSFFKLSEGARAFLQSLLAVDPTQRLTADMALRHPWIRGHAPDKAGASPSVLQSLTSFAGVCPALRASLLPEAQSLPNEDQVPFREEFRALDPGGRGALKGEDLRRALGEEREEEAEKVFAALDIDGDGEVTWSEFLAGTMPQQVLASERMARPPVHLLGLRRSFGVLSKWQDSLKGLYAVSAGVHEWCPWNLDGP